MRCLTLSVGLSLLCFGPIQACGEAPVEPEQAATPSPSGEPAPAGVDGALATVNGVSITPAELEARVGKQIPLTALTQPRIEGVLETMIHEELLYQEALRLKLDQSPRVRRVMTSLLRQEVLEAQLKELSFPEEELLAWYREHQDDYILPEQVRLRRILIKALLRDQLSAQVLDL